MFMLLARVALPPHYLLLLLFPGRHSPASVAVNGHVVHPRQDSGDSHMAQVVLLFLHLLTEQVTFCPQAGLLPVPRTGGSVVNLKD